MSRTAKINLEIKLDDSNIPKKIRWSATEAPFEGNKDSKAIMISIWDSQDRQSLNIDLWTDQMIIGEMNTFFYQTLMKLSETYEKATGNKEIAASFKEFAKSFSDKVAFHQNKTGKIRVHILHLKRLYILLSPLIRRYKLYFISMSSSSLYSKGTLILHK